MRHVLALGDQLTTAVGPLASADPSVVEVLMVESEAAATALPHHKQKLSLQWSASRHFARALEASGFTVAYRRAPSLAAAVTEFVSERGGAALRVMQPSDWEVASCLERAAGDGGGELVVVPNELWLTTEEDFDDWADGRKTLRLEYFYREMRRKRGWLMDGNEPLGDRWNFDADNRETPEPGHDFPAPLRFDPDALTREVIGEVETLYPDHFGSTESFGWPVTREEALRALEDFVEHRLPLFGPFEDAMVEGESVLSVPLNLGLLTPLEVCERALERFGEPHRPVPIQSIEGFIRQVLGWREFMRHVYRRQMPALSSANGLAHREPLPEAYWGAPTDMRCIEQSVAQLAGHGHTHHIQRLMVLGNFALIAGVDPRAVNDWFLGCYVDAWDWVVTPNVMGMSQFADLGSFTSKPYASSGKYVNRMSDHCRACAYDVKRTVGQDACPLNSLYWDFLDRHADLFSSNPRMKLMLANWARRDDESRAKILARAADVKQALIAQTL